MKSEKITKQAMGLRKRWYDDACGTALGLELIGERWALLIIRELMFGPRRFSELRAGLPGISANVLTQRLDGLEMLAILKRYRLPPPASVQVYELTEWGYEAEILVQELGRWAVRSPVHDPTLPLSAASIMMSFRTMFDAARAGDARATIGVRIGPDSFVVRVKEGRLNSERGNAGAADLILTGDPMTIASIVYGGRPPEDAEAAGELSVAGDRSLLARFVTWFPLPEKHG